MNAVVPPLVFYGIVFTGTILLAYGLLTFLTAHNAVQGRVSKRMRLIGAGASNAVVLSALRRDTMRVGPFFTPKQVTDYLEVQLTQAGMLLPVNRLVAMMLTATAAIGLGFPIIGNISGKLHSPAAYLVIAIFAMSVGIGLPIMVISRRAAARIAKLEAQFPIALDIFVRGLRAGHPVSSALDLLVTEVPDPIGSEFGIVIAEMNYGYDLRGALANLARRVKTQDMQMFVVSVAIQAETGGNLANILDGLARVIRDRASMVLKVRALASEGKMTGVVLSVLPVATFCFVFAVQPKFYLDVADDRIFLPAVMAVLAWYTFGIVIMKKMIRIKV